MKKRSNVFRFVFIVLFSLILLYSAVLTVHYKIPNKIISIITDKSKVPMETEATKGEYNYFNNVYYREITSLYKYYSDIKPNIVMIGDSITYRVNWNELLGRNDVINRGIGSDTTLGVLSRLKEIIEKKPKIAFVMIGINDFGKGFSVDEVLKNYIEIISILEKENIEVIVESTLYTRDNKGNINEKVLELNNLLSKYCEEHKNIYMYLNGLLSDGNKLKEEYTIDGVHLLGNAYNIWKIEIEKYL